MDSKQDMTNALGTAPVGRLMLRLAVPTVLAQIVNLLYNIVDRIYIGHMPNVGSAALTGVGLCFPIISFITAFAALIANGGAPRCAIFMGRGDNDTAQRILGSCFSVLVAVALILTAAFRVFGRKMLWLFGASSDTILYSLGYLNIYVLGTLFVMLTLGMNHFIMTQGFTKISMFTVIIGAVINIALDPLFIFAFGMGVRGAALATVIAQCASAIWAVLFLCGKKTILRIEKKVIRPDLKLLLPCLALGLAPFIMQSTESLINISFNSSLQKFGGDVAVGTMTVASTCMQLVWLPSQGIGQGAQPIISFNYGAGNPERCMKAFKCMLRVSAVLLFTFYIVAEVFPTFLMGIFTNDPTLLANKDMLRIYVAVVGFFCIQMSVQQSLVSIGKAKASLFIACLRKIILLIPLIFILPDFFDNKVFAVFLAEPVSDTVSITASAVVFYFVFIKEMRRMKTEDNKTT